MLQLVKIIRAPSVKSQTYFLCRLQVRDTVLIPGGSSSSFLISGRLLGVSPPVREYSSSIPSQYDHLKLLEDIDHKPAPVFICQTCEKSFNSHKSLSQHHQDSERCTGEYHVIPSSADTIAMYDNIQSRSSEEGEPVTKKKGNIKHTCSFCGNGFDSTKKFTRHLKHCHPFQIAKNESEMKGEEEKDLRFIRTSPPGMKLFKCDQCEKSFAKKGNLERQIAFCKICNSTNVDLNPTIVEYSCTDCGRGFTTKSNLSRARRNCKRCNNKQTEAETQSLISIAPITDNVISEDRIKINESEAKKYSCADCGKSYVKKGNLRKAQSNCKRCNPQEEDISMKPSDLPEVNPAIRTSDQEDQEVSHSTISVEDVKMDTPEEIKENRYQKNQEILGAYFDMKVNLGHLEDAYRHFQDIKSKTVNAPNVLCLGIYNSFLRGFAREPFNVHKVESLFEEMESEDIKPDLSSFISLIMSLHEADPRDEYYSLLFKSFVEKCEQEGLSLATALSKGDFLMSDKKMFVQTLRKFGVTEQNLKGSIENSHTSELLSPLQYYGTKNLQSQVEGVLEPEQMSQLLRRQISDERRHRVSIPSIVEHQHSDTFRSFYNSLKRTWRRRIMDALEDLDIKSQQPIYAYGSSANLRPFLTALPKEKLTEVIMARAEEMVTSEGFSMSVIMVTLSLGDDVMRMYQDLLRTEEDSLEKYLEGLARYQDWFLQPRDSGVSTHREAVQRSMEDTHLDSRMTSWPRSVRIAMGKELLSIMINQIVIDRDKDNKIVSGGLRYKDGKLIAAEAQEVGDKSFFRVFRKRKGYHDVEELKPHPALVDLFYLDSERDYPTMLDLSFPPSDLPMVVPPLPWVSHHTGGYLIKRPALVRHCQIFF